MDVIHFPDDPRPSRWKQPVLALGNFDGVHRGHRKILERLRRVAAERGATSVVMTFDPHPPRVVRPDKAPPLLMTKAQKLEAIARAGMQGAAIVRFTPELSKWDPETFVRTVLVDWLRVSEVWVGANFLFGHDRTGNTITHDCKKELKQILTQYIGPMANIVCDENFAKSTRFSHVALELAKVIPNREQAAKFHAEVTQKRLRSV